MEPPDKERARGSGKGCGCLAAAAVLTVIGLPLLFLFSWGLSPCEDGPCDPNGMRNLQIAAAVVAGLAAAAGLATWRLVDWWIERQAARGRYGRRQIELAAIALVLLGAAAVLALVLV